eukprot:CAMPEP_0170483172 /NCGR_PEP_ID=MMETSP0208-20121228/2906_1 /TAXON_ID=197538 /ORGANISM="Strombidium inclinatum, Strain S3" /LENGTH=41 /DNA_ID= /DNA_START= /DNA_END= /DNA_ORIENTATION=
MEDLDEDNDLCLDVAPLGEQLSALEQRAVDYLGLRILELGS